MKRRTVLTGSIGALVAHGSFARALAQGGQSADLAGCLAEPGIALFLDVFQGASTLTSTELLPGADWQVYSTPYTTVAFLYPPDWNAQVLSASTFSPGGAPQWMSGPPGTPGLVSARVVSPDSTAAWEYAVGTLQGVALTIEQAIMVAEGGLLGDAGAGSRLCMHTEQNMAGGLAWLTAVDSNGLLVLTNGTLFADASGFTPYSVLTYYAFAAPRAQFELVMRSVFLPIQWQLLQSGGSLPTPTPTP